MLISVSILQRGKLRLRANNGCKVTQQVRSRLGTVESPRVGLPSPAAPAPGTDPKVGGSEAVGGGHVGGGGGVCVVGVDVGEQGAHDGGHPRAHVLGGEAGKVAGGREWEALGLASSRDRPHLHRMSPRQHLGAALSDLQPVLSAGFCLQASLCLLSGLPCLCL